MAQRTPESIGWQSSPWGAVYFLSAAYFLAIGFVNAIGADDINMLSVFRIDELAIYDADRTMLQGLAGTEGHGLRQFLDPKQHVYGYLYHFLNSLTLIVVRPLNYIIGAGATTFDVLVLRQLSVLYFLIALVMLLHTFLKDARPVATIAAWLGIVMCPAVLFNNTWMHPDNLALLLIVCACVALIKDRGTFKRWFWIASIFWGLAINTKLLGLFLFPAFAYYCFAPGTNHPWHVRTRFSKLFTSGCVALAVYLATSPHLYFDSNFANFLRAMSDYSKTYVLGTRNEVTEAKPLLWYRTVISPGYFQWWFLLSMAGGWYFLARANIRSALILSLATVPLLLNFLFNVGWTGYWYLIPTLVPAMVPTFALPRTESLPSMEKFASYGVLALAMAQLGINASESHTLLREEVAKERNSPSIALYRLVEERMGDRIDSVKSVFRDPYIYIPDRDGVTVTMKWGLATYSDIAKNPADLVVLQKEYIERCADDAALHAYMDYMKQSYEENYACREFYSDAKKGKLRGFQLLVENEYGMAFVRSNL